MSYVFQMVYGSTADRKEGLFFPSEPQARDTEFMQFVIPLDDDLIKPGYQDIIDSLNNTQFLFPFLWRNEYQVLEAAFVINNNQHPLIQPPTITYTVKWAGDMKINFSLDLKDDNVTDKPAITVQQYIGNDKGLIIPGNAGFITLLPVDVDKMDFLYLNYRGLFVGRNPNFLE